MRFQKVDHSAPNLSEVLKDVVGGSQLLALKLVPKVGVLVVLELLLKNLKLSLDLVLDIIAGDVFEGFLKSVQSSLNSTLLHLQLG